MKLNVLTSMLIALFLFSGCEKSEDVTPEPTVQTSTFEGKIFNQAVSYITGQDNFQSNSGLWVGGGESFAELALETPGQMATDTRLSVYSKIVASPLTPARFKELFAVGTKSAENMFAGYHIVFFKDGQTYSTAGGEQPANFLEVTKLEELPNPLQNYEFNFKVEFKINANLYKYGAPHEYAGKIENGKMVVYYVR